MGAFAVVLNTKQL